MADVWVVLVVLTFFGLCVAMVWGCDRIIGADQTEPVELIEAAEAVDA